MKTTPTSRVLTLVPDYAIHFRGRMLLLGTFMLSGCVALAPEAVDVHRTAAIAMHASLSDPSVADAIARAGLPDPNTKGAWDLDALMVAAWTLRPELAEARLLQTAAANDVDSASKPPNPVLSLIPEFSRGAVDSSPWTIAAALSTVIVNPSVRRAQVDRAQAQSTKARWQYASVAWKIASEVRQSWWMLGSADRALSLSEQEDALAAERAALASRRFEAGAVGRGEMTRWQALRSQAAFALQGAQRQQSDARAQLALALSVPVAELAQLHLANIPAPPILQRDAAQDTETALFNRVDLAQALASFAEADASWRESVASRFPGLSIAPGYTFDRGDRKWVMGLAAELPLFDRKDAAISALAARKEAAIRRVETVQIQALAQVSRALSDLTGIQSALGMAESAIAMQKRATEVSVRRFSAGLAESSTLLDARAQLLTLKRSKLDLESQQIAAIGALESATQRPAWPTSAVQPESSTQLPVEGKTDVARN